MKALTLMSLNLRYGAVKDSEGTPEDRWPGIRDLILDAGPEVVLFQEAMGWREKRCEQWARAEEELEMRIHVGPSPSGAHTAVAHRPEIAWKGLEDRYAARTLNGFTQIALDIGAELPLVVISAHLDPYSAQAAAQEMQLLVARAYRGGGLGLIGGDINHCPVGDPEPDWWSKDVRPYNRSSRTVLDASGELCGNTAVAEVALQAGLTDVAGHLANVRDDPSLRAPTGRSGVRVDQVYVTPALLPAIGEYEHIPTAPFSDHDAIVALINLDCIDLSKTESWV